MCKNKSKELYEWDIEEQCPICKHGWSDEVSKKDRMKCICNGTGTIRRPLGMTIIYNKGNLTIKSDGKIVRRHYEKR